MSTGFERLVHKRRQSVPPPDPNSLGAHIPGIGGGYYNPEVYGGREGAKRPNRGGPIYRAPSNPKEDAAQKKIFRRRTRPTPGSRPHRPRID